MPSKLQAARRREIEAAAYEVLAEKGYKATSMLAIAKRAAASNETLYRWYGNKQTLFRALVEENARDVRERLQASIEHGSDPLATLKAIGPLLLKLVTSDKAVALNRAAASDVFDTGTLGETIAAGGRGTIVPLIARLFEAARARRLVTFADAEEITRAYVSLLIGDLQIRRVIGVQGALSSKEIQARADWALAITLRAFAN